MTPKDFLLNECENVRNVLREVLRHDYAAGSSEVFYKEFNERLALLRQLIDPVDPSDAPALAAFAAELSLLSALVHQIERSHTGEFSWPFAECLESIAVPVQSSVPCSGIAESLECSSGRRGRIHSRKTALAPIRPSGLRICACRSGPRDCRPHRPPGRPRARMHATASRDQGGDEPMKRLLCWLGFHSWKYCEMDAAFFRIDLSRCCAACGRLEYRDALTGRWCRGVVGQLRNFPRPDSARQGD